jgi:hypothetical protein
MHVLKCALPGRKEVLPAGESLVLFFCRVERRRGAARRLVDMVSHGRHGQ